MKIVFWGLVVVDALGIALFFLLGLAAAGSSRTSPLQVALVLLVLPASLLAGAVVLFLKAGSPGLRLLAILVAATPLAVAISARTIAQIQYNSSTNAAGEMTFFRAGPMREISEAITRNDTGTVSALVRKVDVNRAGLDGMSLLGLAMRQLRETPDRQQVLRLLLEAGANPNHAAQYELPLSVAIQLAGRAGPAPVRLLLDAGANPNLPDSFGQPVYFSATGQSAGSETLVMLLDRGADANAMTANGGTSLFAAATTRNWKAALLLLQRGADWKQGKSVNGLDFMSLVESYAGQADDSELAAVLQFIRQR